MVDYANTPTYRIQRHRSMRQQDTKMHQYLHIAMLPWRASKPCLYTHRPISNRHNGPHHGSSHCPRHQHNQTPENHHQIQTQTQTPNGTHPHTDQRSTLFVILSIYLCLKFNMYF